VHPSNALIRCGRQLGFERRWLTCRTGDHPNHARSKARPVAINKSAAPVTVRSLLRGPRNAPTVGPGNRVSTERTARHPVVRVSAVRRISEALVVAATVLVPGLATATTTPTVASNALVAGPHQAAEAVVALDDRNPQRMAVAADPYLGPVQVRASLTEDAGRTWGPPIPLVPQGFAKSYDPVLAFTNDGPLLVVAGASQLGPPNCQPGSAIFTAHLGQGPPKYQIVRPPSYGTYVDRPFVGYDRRRQRVLVTWTESSGPGAECSGLPVRSQLMLSVSHADGSFSEPTVIPTATATAPFGSAIAIDDDGSLVIVTVDRQPRTARLLVVRSVDGGQTFAAPEVLAEAAPLPTELPGLGGLVSPTPAVAVHKGRTAIAWSAVDATGVHVSVFEALASGPFATLPAVPTEAAAVILPQLSYDRGGRLWRLAGNLRGRELVFDLAGWDGGWSDAGDVGSGPSDRYQEVGEQLGLAVAGDAIATAVPIDGDTASVIDVTWRLEPTPSPTTTVSAVDPADASTPRPRRTRHRGWLTAPLGAAGLGIVILAGGSIFGARRSKRQKALRTGAASRS
jgi:hypothetical protein